MKNKHTAGQWQVYIQPTEAGTTRTVNVGSKRIATLCFMSTIEESEGNAKLIAAAPELLQMVYDLKNCIKRLTQDNLSQFERDTEAQWEGEAHELLTRINPGYYHNANELTHH